MNKTIEIDIDVNRVVGDAGRAATVELVSRDRTRIIEIAENILRAVKHEKNEYRIPVCGFLPPGVFVGVDAGRTEGDESIEMNFHRGSTIEIKHTMHMEIDDEFREKLEAALKDPRIIEAIERQLVKRMTMRTSRDDFDAPRKTNDERHVTGDRVYHPEDRPELNVRLRNELPNYDSTPIEPR
ncbi:MAG: hypothetical protein M3209_00130 [Acidobacteriota bacterium]|nr:hypothetical protein [Acidobacteriota bacterium]